jgi:hypothetical protein
MQLHQLAGKVPAVVRKSETGPHFWLRSALTFLIDGTAWTTTMMMSGYNVERESVHIANNRAKTSTCLHMR